MEEQSLFKKLKKVLLPYVEDEGVLTNVKMSDHLTLDMKIDSYNLIEIILDVEELFGIEVPDESIGRMETFGSCMNILKRNLVVAN